ncbi:MAG: hypothetical protein LUI14_00780 [Lachnospiraceae bacterium]|nr:hypothetical protein [Lachnospiraceae bacterium]MCD7765609.1 hypothetical protein [Lachnospiraceae bacterium]
MKKKELLSVLIETERDKLNRLIEAELLSHETLAGERAGGGESHSCLWLFGHSEEIYHQSRYLDRLIELYMECA